MPLRLDDLPFPYWDLIRSPAPPSPTDTAIINWHIQQQDVELGLVSAEIIQLREMIAQLVARRTQLLEKQTQLRRSVERHKSLFAPIRRLPPELLSQIFIHCSYDDSDLPRYSPLRRPPPLRLQQVNSRWRDVVLSTPQLWANLTIESEINPNLLSAWLARSGACPFDITINDVLAPHPPFQSMTPPALVALCRRMRSLTIKMEGRSYDVPPLFPIQPVDMPFLEKLCVYLDDLNPSGFGVIPFASAPRLRHCDLRRWDELSQHTPLPWSQLTSLKLADQSNVLEILRRCPNLITLELHECSLYIGDLSTTIPPVLLPRLTALAIDRPDPARGLASLDLPCLQSLRIQLTFVQRPLYLPAQCNLRLEEIEILSTVCLPPEDVESCLARPMPELRHLDLNGDTVRILSLPVADNERRLPKLKSIVTGHESSLADMVHFIKTRWNPCDSNSESIEKICARLSCSEAPSAEQLAFLRKCIDEGLDLRCDDHGTWWPVRSGDESRGKKEFGWTYPDEEAGLI